MKSALSCWRFIVFTLLATMLVSPVSASQANKEPRKIRVKVVYDQFFAKNAEYIIKHLFQKQSTGWSATNSDDLAFEIIEKLSQQYQELFGITFIPIRPTTNVIIPTEILTDKAYVWVLQQCSCDGAELMIGLTGALITPAENKAKDSENIYRTVFIYASAGSHEPSGRIFARLHIEGNDSKRMLAKTLDSLDHEMKHMFGTKHPPGVMAGSAEEQLFFFESIAIIHKNRAKQFNCQRNLTK